MPPGQNGVFQMSRISGWSECKQGLGQRCQDDRGSYTQCCEVTWMKYTSLDCVSSSLWLRRWPTCSPWEAWPTCSPWVHPVLFSSHLTWCLGHWGLEGMRTMVFSHWKGTGMFATKPSSWLQCLQIKAESKASRPSILGVWSWMAPEGCGVGGGWQYHPQSSATHNCLLVQWSPEYLLVLFSPQMNSYAESYVWGQVQWSRWRTGGPSQYPTPPPAPWLDMSQNLLCTLIVWMWEERLGVGLIFLRVTWPVSRRVETSPTLVPALCSQGSLSPLWWVCAMHLTHPRTITNYVSVLSSVSV